MSISHFSRELITLTYISKAVLGNPLFLIKARMQVRFVRGEYFL